MSHPIRSAAELQGILRECAGKLESDSGSSQWPRIAKDAIDDWLVHSKPDGAVVELFTLSLLLDHLLTVLTGDVVYERESGTLRDGIFALVPPVMLLAADAAGALLAYVGLFFYLGARSRQLATLQGYSRALRDSAGFPSSEFQMTRAGQTRVFLDADQWLADADRLSHACEWIARSVEAWKVDGHRVDGLAFVDKDSGPVGMLAMQHMVAVRTGLPTCLVRLRRWPFLPQGALKGFVPKKGSVFVIVSDVATTGGHIGRAAEVLRHQCWGIDVDLALVLLNRGSERVTSALRREHISVQSMPEVQATFEEKARRAEEEYPHS